MGEIVIGKRRIMVEQRRRTPAEAQIAKARLAAAPLKNRECEARAAGRTVHHLDVPRGKGRFAVSERSERTIDGQAFASKKESRRYTQLMMLQRARQISGLAVQPSWDIDINGKRFTRYTADFSYFCNERNRTVIEDVKSTGTAKDEAYRLRRKAAELTFQIRIDEVLM